MQVYLWYPVSIVAGGTTAKILVSAKDNFVGKYIYKDTLARNLAGVIYKVSSIIYTYISKVVDLFFYLFIYIKQG